MTFSFFFCYKGNYLRDTVREFFLFLNLFLSYLRGWGGGLFASFESVKAVFVVLLYKQRGRLARPFLHSGMGVLAATSIMLAPVVAQELPGALTSEDPWERVPAVLSANTENPQTTTVISDKLRDTVVEYTVLPGDTVSGIAEKFSVSPDTLRWQNKLSGDKLKDGQIIKILPVTGIAHRVSPGDTIYSISKRYSAEPQALVDFPFNTFTNDETFELAVGQIIIVPDGVPPAAAPTSIARRRTPDAGTVVASGVFVWPVSGELSQRFAWYHRGIDIANKGAPDILAADSGQIEFAGCVGGGYGCHVIVHHGNGSQTLYAHLSKIYVGEGQGVARGDTLGKMGSTGRSTGTHLHFEVIQNGIHVNPLDVLK